MITGFMVSQNVDNQESLLLSHPVDREVRAGGLDYVPGGIYIRPGADKN